MKIVFMGTPDFAIPSLKAMIESSHEVVGVVTQPDRPQGRGLKMRPPPVKDLAETHAMPVLQPERLGARSFREVLRGLEGDLFVVVAFRILPASVLSIPACGAVNLHASLLPKYRGAAPIQWAIVNGEKVSGVTTFLLDQNVDTGNILMQREMDIGPDETGGELYQRLMVEGASLLRETVDQIGSRSHRPVKQSGAASAAPKLKKTDGLLNWRHDSEALHNRIRGLNPYPMAFTSRGGKNLRIMASRQTEREASGGLPGEIIAADESDGLIVRTGSGGIEITEVQPEGKKRMSALEYIRGYRITIGDRLGDEHHSA